MIQHRKKDLLWFSHDDVSVPNVRYGFFSKIGGVQDGDIPGLTVGGPVPEKTLAHNKQLIADALEVDPAQMRAVTQVHGTRGVWVTSEDQGQEEADALLTQTPGLVLGIKTADCVPVIMMAETGKAVAAIHAGWRGLAAGILETTCASLRQKVGEVPLLAVVGPCIHQASYEVDQAVYEVFVQTHADQAVFFDPVSGKAGHYKADLPGLAVHALKRSGILDPKIMALDTYTEKELFYSCRRSAHEGQGTQFGRQLSFVQIEE